MQKKLFSDLRKALYEANEHAKNFKFVMTVTGSRSIEDKVHIYSCLDDFLVFHKLKPSRLTLNSGHARGVDLIAEEWAKERGIKIVTYPADWNYLGHPDCVPVMGRFGKMIDINAGKRRNKEMVDVSDLVCVIWDGQSTGTKHCMDYAKSVGVSGLVYELGKERRPLVD